MAAELLNDITASAKNASLDILNALPIKAVFATLGAIFVEKFGGTVEVLYCYLAFMTLDLLLGVIVAVTWGKFNFIALHRWMIKVLVQFIVATVIATFFYMFHETAGVTIAVINWIFLTYAFTDISSILEKFEQLGFKLPLPAKLMVKMLRRKASKKIAALVEDPDAEKEIEEALGGKTSKKPKG